MCHEHARAHTHTQPVHTCTYVQPRTPALPILHVCQETEGEERLRLLFSAGRHRIALCSCGGRRKWRRHRLSAPPIPFSARQRESCAAPARPGALLSPCSSPSSAVNAEAAAPRVYSCGASRTRRGFSSEKTRDTTFGQHWLHFNLILFGTPHTDSYAFLRHCAEGPLITTHTHTSTHAGTCTDKCGATKRKKGVLLFLSRNYRTRRRSLFVTRSFPIVCLCVLLTSPAALLRRFLLNRCARTTLFPSRLLSVREERCH